MASRSGRWIGLHRPLVKGRSLDGNVTISTGDGKASTVASRKNPRPSTCFVAMLKGEREGEREIGQKEARTRKELAAPRVCGVHGARGRDAIVGHEAISHTHRHTHWHWRAGKERRARGGERRTVRSLAAARRWPQRWGRLQHNGAAVARRGRVPRGCLADRLLSARAWRRPRWRWAHPCRRG